MPRPLADLRTAAGVLAALVLAGALLVHADVVAYTRAASDVGVELPAPSFAEASMVAAEWTGTVALPALLLLWAATRGAARPWLPAATAAVLLTAWVAGASLPPDSPTLAWPGPVQPYDWAADSPDVPLLHPSRVLPLLLALACAVAARTGMRARPAAPPAPATLGAAGTATRTGLVALALVGATATALTDRSVLSLSDADGLVTPVAAFALVLTAAVCSGRLWSIAPLALTSVAVAVPWVEWWFDGGPDVLLLVPAIATAATLVAWSWRPLATRLDAMLVTPVPPVAPGPSGGAEAATGPTPPSAREGADADL